MKCRTRRWFTNRLGTVPVTVDELVKGPGSGTGPAPGGWTVISAKNDGVMPGFTVRDSAGQVWFIKFDPPGYPAMATGTEVVVARLFWGLGYHVPETHLATLRPEQLTIDDAGPHHIAKRQPAALQGIGYPAAAAQSAPRIRWIVPRRRQQGARRAAGRRFPVLRHAVRRSQRRDPARASSRAAGLRHVRRLAEPRRLEVDQHARHARRAGREAVVRHHLLDFGSTIGSAGVYPREAYEGWEYLVEGKKTLAGMPSLGLYVKNWRTIPLYRARSVGAFPIDNTQWDPERWKPRYANSAFRSARLDDKFWAARRLQAFTDEMLNALIGVGQFNDPKSEEMLVEVPDRAPQRDSPSLSSGREPGRRRAPVAFGYVDVPERRSGCGRGARAQRVRRGLAAVRQCDRHDDEPRRDPRVGDERQCAERSSCGSGTYIRVEISANGGPESWTEPAHAYFRREAAGWTLVGFERVPSGNPPGSKGASRRTN